jgi:pentatricopeptide repeat protein
MDAFFMVRAFSPASSTRHPAFVQYRLLGELLSPCRNERIGDFFRHAATKYVDKEQRLPRNTTSFKPTNKAIRPVQPTADMQLGNNSTAHNPNNESISKSNQLTSPAASKRRASKSTSSNRTGTGTSIRTLLADTRRKRQLALATGAPTPPLTQAYCDYLLAECVSHDEWDLVLDVIDLMKDSGREQVASTYTACLQACFQTANAASARDVLAAQVAAGLVPALSDIALTIMAMCRRDQIEPGWWRKALTLLHEYQPSTPKNVVVSNKTQDLPLAVYDALLTCMVRDKQWKEAIRLLRSMEQTSSTAPTTRPSLSTYRTVIECCVVANEAEQAVQVLQSCIKSGLTPTAFAFELVVGALTKKLQWRRALQLLNVMEELQVPRNVAIYNLILTACAKAKEADQAKALLQRMRRRDGLVPNIISYNSVLSSCASTSRWRDALAVLDLVHREPGVTPDVYTYTK